ncbi:diguanylate cyclase domain-containing protein [Deinococcus humi]|uniref:Diguanylate cyclase (GGDEF)-like protein n=1 Tax=Deinococcus humi TaxID=662880 RepID=A0A7W8NDY0_9DEIO|nr:diguanylate cyclase (GGDEF)-like protein [Deinococcus humi]
MRLPAPVRSGRPAPSRPSGQPVDSAGHPLTPVIAPGDELKHALHQRLALAALACGLPVLAILWVLEARSPSPNAELIGVYAVMALLCLWGVVRVLRRSSLDVALKIIVSSNLVFIAAQAYVGGAGQSVSEAQTQFSMLLMLIANAVLGHLIFGARRAGRLALGGFVLAVVAGLLGARQGGLDGALPSAQLYLSTGTILLLLQALAWYKSRFVTQAQAQLRLEHEAYTDPLTGLANRRRLYQRVADLLEPVAGAQEDGEGGSVVMFDLDHFKRVNDLHGHLAGDSALMHVAALLRATAQPGETPGRWGGEEFMLVLPGIGQAGALRRAQEVQRLLASSPHPQVGPLTASFGVSASLAGDDLTRLVARADDALYRAKSGGRDRIEMA